MVDIPFDYDARGYFVLDDYGVETAPFVDCAYQPQRVGGPRSREPWMNPHREANLFLNLMRNKTIVGIVEKLIRGPAVGLQSQFYYCPPGTKGYARHQDNFFVEAPFGCFCSVWMPLVDVGPHNGGLTVYPGTHLLGRLPVRRLHDDAGPNQDPNARNEETILPRLISQPPADLIISAGSVVFLHGNIVHASHANGSDGNRYAVLNTYIRKGAPFRKGQRADREEVALL